MAMDPPDALSWGDVMNRQAMNGFVSGLEGVVAAQTRLSHVDGELGKLLIAGFPVEEIAPRASFEEVLHLLWRGELPDVYQLTALQRALAAQRAFSPATADALREAASQHLPPMDALRLAAGTLSLSTAASDLDGQAFSIVARFPTLVAAYWRLLHGQTPISPRDDLGHAANYLYMLSGETPGDDRVRALETYLNTVVDHGLNASTFTARVIMSTGSDLVSAIVGAVGALKGPKHGGAPGPALDMVFEIGDASRAEAYVRAKLDRKELLMGFGHRVYRVRDPRAEVLGAAAEALYRAGGDMALYTLARDVERVAVALLAERHPGRNLQTNVEFYTALLLHGLGLPTELFSPTFAISRVGGWIAHCFEQAREGRIIRPQSEYVGPLHRAWVPVENRPVALAG